MGTECAAARFLNQDLVGKFILGPIGEKTRGIASLQKNGLKSDRSNRTTASK